jgi:hypothetical protein
MDPDFQVRMLFTQHLGPAAILDLVRTELRYRTAQHEHPVPYDASLVPEDAGPQETAWSQEIYLLLTQRGRSVVSSFIAWLESTEARLAVLVESNQHPPVTASPAAGDARRAGPVGRPSPDTRPRSAGPRRRAGSDQPVKRDET